eukprot:450755-Pelagomonas_calceolata.AAC.5
MYARAHTIQSTPTPASGAGFATDMGVPGLFAWLRKRYPEISSPLIKKKDGAYTGIRGKVDNLYIVLSGTYKKLTLPRTMEHDGVEGRVCEPTRYTNHIIHACAHGSVAKGRDRLTEQQNIELSHVLFRAAIYFIFSWTCMDKRKGNLRGQDAMDN